MPRTSPDQTPGSPDRATSRRVLFVTTLPVTLTAFLLPHADALRQKGWRVDCLTAPPGAGGVGTPADEALIGEQFDARYSAGWSRSAVASLLRYPALATQVRSVVSAGRYDIVHVHTPIASFIVRAALRRTPRPRIVYTAHGFHFMEGQTGLAARLYRAAERRAAAWTDDLVVMNDQDERAAGPLTAGTACRVHRIDGVGVDLAAYRKPYSSVDHAAAAQLNADLGSSPEDFVVATLGELNRNKRTALLVRAVHILRDTIPNLRLVVAGDGPMRSALEDEISLLGLGEVVKLMGHVSRDTLRVIASRADVGVLVSEREGLPRSLMEFVAAGTPIAGTRTRGITDEVVDERAIVGGSVTSGDAPTPGELAEVIERLWSDEDLRDELLATQYERAQQRYDLPVILEKYRALYES